MATTYIGNSHKCKKLYLGVKEPSTSVVSPRIVKKAYIGDAQGIPRLVFNNSVMIKYNANGGSGAPADQEKEYDENLTLSSTVPTRTGYEFKGWGTFSTDEDADYAAGGICTTNFEDDITLYAIWQCLHNSSYQSLSGCTLYEYCSTCNGILNSSPSHDYITPGSNTGTWTYYNDTYHNYTATCTRCGGPVNISDNHSSTKYLYEQNTSTKHNVYTYCLGCNHNIGSSFTQDHTFVSSEEENNGVLTKRSTCSLCGYSKTTDTRYRVTFKPNSTVEAYYHDKLGETEWARKGESYIYTVDGDTNSILVKPVDSTIYETTSIKYTTNNVTTVNVYCNRKQCTLSLKAGSGVKQFYVDIYDDNDQKVSSLSSSGNVTSYNQAIPAGYKYAVVVTQYEDRYEQNASIAKSSITKNTTLTISSSRYERHIKVIVQSQGLRTAKVYYGTNLSTDFVFNGGIIKTFNSTLYITKVEVTYMGSIRPQTYYFNKTIDISSYNDGVLTITVDNPGLNLASST